MSDENGVPKIESFDRVRMRCRLSEVANFFTLRKGEGGCYEQVGTNPPLSLAENVLIADFVELSRRWQASLVPQSCAMTGRSARRLATTPSAGSCIARIRISS